MMRYTKWKSAPFSHEYLKSILHYIPQTGEWLWRRNNKPTGEKAADGYRVIRIRLPNREVIKVYSAFLAFYFVNGVQLDPKQFTLMHLNGNPLDDRWENLSIQLLLNGKPMRLADVNEY